MARILLIEDDESVATALRDLLASEGFTADIAIDATQGLYAGGFFRTTGSVPSDRIGLWVELFPTAVGETPTALRLEQNVPNPFNPVTTIRYTLDRSGPTTLRVYDVRGARVRTLVDGEQGSGPHAIQWDGSDDRGVRLASGVYFCRLETATEARVMKMTVLK
jgi:hypothetical protein